MKTIPEAVGAINPDRVEPTQPSRALSPPDLHLIAERRHALEATDQPASEQAYGQRRQRGINR
ncbi:hypothetical protein ACFOKI_04885 [Sphingomonas qilianensis]|uniref:Uncharacterized protein n=1 Tax=Sphingomonas qilianensis TaxID=1736690 RepID=A0ABU9XUM2_9SPHN